MMSATKVTSLVASKRMTNSRLIDSFLWYTQHCLQLKWSLFLLKVLNIAHKYNHLQMYSQISYIPNSEKKILGKNVQLVRWCLRYFSFAENIRWQGMLDSDNYTCR